MPLISTLANAGVRGYGFAGLSLATAPIIGTATATGSSTASVNFTAPLSNGGSPILSYTAVAAPGGQSATVTQSGSGTINVGGLTSGEYYTFVVYATTVLGNSPNSQSSNQIRMFGVPNAPTIVSAFLDGTSAATVNYTGNYNGGATVTSFVAISSPGGYSGSVNTSGNLPITVSGLQAGTTYQFRVYANNAYGASSFSEYSNAVTTPAVFNISVSPSSASTTIARQSAPVTSYASFNVTATSGSGSITVQEIQRPTGGSTTVSPSAFSLGTGGSQTVNVSATSPNGNYSNNEYIYGWGILKNDGGTYPTFTFTQFR